MTHDIVIDSVKRVLWNMLLAFDAKHVLVDHCIAHTLTTLLKKFLSSYYFIHQEPEITYYYSVFLLIPHLFRYPENGEFEFIQH